jgi:hypothetical protein
MSARDCSRFQSKRSVRRERQISASDAEGQDATNLHGGAFGFVRSGALLECEQTCFQKELVLTLPSVVGRNDF